MKKGKGLLLLSIVGMLTAFAPGKTANAEWQDTSAGRIYTQTEAPGYLTGMQKIDGCTYYFNADGIMQTGLQTINKKLYYFDADGKLKIGHITAPDGERYYGVKTKQGALAQNRWVGKYYFQADGRMAKSTWINGKWVGADGRYTGIKGKVGWITSGSKTYYYDTNQKMVKGWLNLNGKTYYLKKTNGVLLKGWFKVGKKTYYADSSGALVKSAWKNGKYLKSNGVMATGKITIGKKTYILGSNGAKQKGWVLYKGNYYYCSSGVVKKNTWVNKNTQYVLSSGIRAAGWTDIGADTYYFDPKTGVKKTKWVRVGGQRYYLGSKGKLYKNCWISNKYYASETGALLTGLQAVGGSLYYFNKTSGKKYMSKLVTIGSDTYYFQNNGKAVQGKWVAISSKYYYFQADGKMAKSTWIDNYYVGDDGVRTDLTKKTGWQTVDGKKYYFNTKGEMLTGWQTISGNRYYFEESGAMLTGIQIIDNTKYYFYSTGELAISTTIAVGTKQYTINASGVVTAEESMKITGDTLGVQIVNFALQYVGNPYVYGGVSLTKGADCSGFVQTVFANFDIKLLRVADDQMKGPSSSYIKNYGYKKAVTVDSSSMQPGDLIFYGSSNYASHVAIYMGNGQIVHASNSQPYPKGGIKISNYDYQTPIRIVRYWS